MFVVKLGTPSRANYEHFHVYLAYRRQTGTVMTRQTYDRAPRLTRPPTAHISRGDNIKTKSNHGDTGTCYRRQNTQTNVHLINSNDIILCYAIWYNYYYILSGSD